MVYCHGIARMSIHGVKNALGTKPCVFSGKVASVVSRRTVSVSAGAGLHLGMS